MKKIEILENQRWYTFLGWSMTLKDNDPPNWSDVHRKVELKKDMFPSIIEWEYYKSDEYDENGWIYGKDNFFLDEFGPKKLDSCIRSRLWLSKNENIHVKTDLKHKRNEDKIFKIEKNNNLTSSDSKITKSSYFNSFSSLSIEKAMQLASDSIISVKEVSAYAADSLQNVTTNILMNKENNKIYTTNMDSTSPIHSMLSKRFLDLSPEERNLISICNEEIDSNSFLAPPEKSIAITSCRQCLIQFNITKLRYYCGYCSEAFCRDDLPHSKIIYTYNQKYPTKVCISCYTVLENKEKVQRKQWRTERSLDYIQNKLISYYNTETDTPLDIAMRAANGTLLAAKKAPLGAAASFAVNSADFLQKYGKAGLLGILLRNEFLESFNTLKELIGNDELFVKNNNIKILDLAKGFYYYMSSNRGLRGSNPNIEKEQHNTCNEVEDDILYYFLHFSNLALHTIYQTNPLDIQRLCQLQNFSLIYIENILNSSPIHPAFALVANRHKQELILVIRGSKSVNDLLIDVKAAPKNSKESSTNVKDLSNDHSNKETIEVDENNATENLDLFAHEGMLRAALEIKEKIIESLEVFKQKNYKIYIIGHSLGGGCAALLSILLKPDYPSLLCFAYAVPACVDTFIAEKCKDYVYSIILHDDCVPRIKPENVKKLVSFLINYKTEWQSSYEEDVEAFKDRAKTLWVPKKREWAIEEADKLKKKTFLPLDINQTKYENDECNNKALRTQNSNATSESSWTLTRNNLMDKLNKVHSKIVDKKENDTYTIKNDEITLSNEKKDDISPELFVPGKIIHLYFFKGIYEAVYIDKESDFLSNFPIYQNMIDDHRGKNYMNALKIAWESKKIKNNILNNYNLPDWIPFHTKTRCMCCNSPFTWNSTSSSESQQNWDQHNCRKCGWLVCDGCSEKRKEIPEYGINVAARICDKCFSQIL